MLTMIGLIFVSSALVIGIGVADLDSVSGALVLQALFALVLAGAALLVASSMKGFAGAAELGFRSPSGSYLRDTVLAFFAYLGLAFLISLVLTAEQTDVTRTLGVGETAAASIAAGLLICVAAPLSEELFFRGFAFAGLRSGLSFIPAAVISGGVWGLFHLSSGTNLVVVLQLGLFGVVLAWLYERTGSLWPPIALHAFNNVIAFTLLTA